MSFVVGYQKHWPNGVQEIPIRCYVTGQERVDKLSWLKVGEIILARGEVADKGAVYAHQLEQLSRPARDAATDDAFLSGMQRANRQ